MVDIINLIILLILLWTLERLYFWFKYKILWIVRAPGFSTSFWAHIGILHIMIPGIGYAIGGIINPTGRLPYIFAIVSLMLEFVCGFSVLTIFDKDADIKAVLRYNQKYTDGQALVDAVIKDKYNKSKK